MIRLKINNQSLEIAEGATVLQAAEKLGIEIPTMCYREGFHSHPGCMVCVVKDAKTGLLKPSCALAAEEGMNIITDDEEVFSARQESLELLLSEHVGDCEAPCRVACPAFMDIPLMNRLLANGQFAQALEIVKQEIAIPIVLGYICPAPCEKACRRNQVDEPVNICKLKKMAAQTNASSSIPFLPEKLPDNGKKIAVVGSGPAGLSAAYHALIYGYSVDVFDKNPKPGGTLRYDIPEEKLPKTALDTEISLIEKLGANFIVNSLVDPDFLQQKLIPAYDAVILASGNFEGSNLNQFGFELNTYGLVADRNTLEVNQAGIFACGNVIRSRRMAVTSVAQGKQAAASAHAWLSGQQPKRIERGFNSKFGKLFDSETSEYLKESHFAPREEENSAFDSLTAEQTRAEAARCMHCDCRKPKTCKLRNYAEKYDANQRRFQFADRKQIEKFTEHELIVFEPGKCIHCNLCVEISSRQKDQLGFTNIGRGFHVKVSVPLNKSLKDIYNKTALECAKACPTGAISLKNP